MSDRHKLTDDVSETLRELFETVESNFTTQVNKTLSQGANTNDVKEWKRKQNTLRKRMFKHFEREGKVAKGMVKEAIERAGKYANFNPEKIIKEVEENTNVLIQSAKINHGDRVKKINRLEKTRPLEKSIFQQTQEGIEKGIPIVTKGGSTVGYKEYMEMKVRTDVQTEISEKQLEFGEKANIVFYVTNVYADCADDHADYQGKMYYDERFENFSLNDEAKQIIREKIKSDNLLSIQQVRNNKPYLTTRPNCRHTFNAISIDQAITLKDDQIVNKLNLKRGSYKPKNYKELQQQRYQERNVRHYKKRLDMNRELYETSPNEYLKKQITKDRMLVSKWQKRQRDLIKANPNLERDYRRETRKVLLQDLGAKYNTPKKPPVAPSVPTPPKPPPKTLSVFRDHQRSFLVTKEKWFEEQTEVERKALQSGLKKAIKDNDFGMAIPRQVLGKILDDGKFKNQFETGISSGLNDRRVRTDASQKFFGFNAEEASFKDSDFEKYGYVMDDVYGEDNVRRTRHYGDVHIRFKKENLLERTTMTVGDSLDHYYSRFRECDAIPVSVNDIPDKMLPDYYFDEALDNIHNIEEDKLFQFTENVGYLELQIHGDLTVDDVKSVTFTFQKDEDGWNENYDQIKQLLDKKIEVIAKFDDWEEDDYFKKIELDKDNKLVFKPIKRKGEK